MAAGNCCETCYFSSYPYALMNNFYKQVTRYDACPATCLAGCVSNVWVSPAQHAIAHVVASLTLMQPCSLQR